MVTRRKAHRGRRDAKLGGDLLARIALPAQLLDLFNHRLGRRPMQAMGPRAAATARAFRGITTHLRTVCYDAGH